MTTPTVKESKRQDKTADGKGVDVEVIEPVSRAPPSSFLSCSTASFYGSLHASYIVGLSSKLDSPTSYEGAVTEHLRMSGVYWSLTALSILRSPSEVEYLMNLSGRRKAEKKEQGGNGDVVGCSDRCETDYCVVDEEIVDDKAREKQQGQRREKSIVDWVFECHDAETGGFGGNVGHDAHILYTLSALQILSLVEEDRNDGDGYSGEECDGASTAPQGVGLHDPRLDRDGVVRFISGLQQPDGSFAGDRWGEIDTRFSYCALSCLSILGVLPTLHDGDRGDGEGGDLAAVSDESEDHLIINIDAAVRYVASCQNFDGGFGCVPGAESHAGQIFCCVGTLAIAGALHLLDADLLCWWLAERQCDSGGLNGRPEKQADVCYSWWILSALSILGRVSWLNADKLTDFILLCQDMDDGGIADRPDNMADAFHTFFGISGISLLGCFDEGCRKVAIVDDMEALENGDGETSHRRYRTIDPLYALPTDVVERLNLGGQVVRPQGCVTSAESAFDARLVRYKTFLP